MSDITSRPKLTERGLIATEDEEILGFCRTGGKTFPDVAWLFRAGVVDTNVKEPE